jgi:hypothetical protein
VLHVHSASYLHDAVLLQTERTSHETRITSTMRA